jgi:plastocyanin
MDTHWIRKPVLLGLGLSATLAVAAAGCGGEGTNKDEGVLVSAPDASVNSKATTTAPSASGTSSAGGAASTSSSAPPASAPVKAEGWGTLKGTIVFGGPPPEAKILQAQGKAEKDPDTCAKTAPIVSERLIVDSATKGVKNAFVYLIRPSAVNPEAKKAAESAKPEFDQKGCVFHPHTLAVMVGETVKVKTSDGVPHNVNFQLRALQENKVLAPGNTMDVTPSSPERSPGPVSCSIHPWMQAYWLVLDHPYFAITDEKGNFEIKNVPAGTQKVVVWQEAVGPVTASSGEDVNIVPNGDTTKSFTIDPTKVRGN